MFKYPQHMAWETRGEVEPSDLELLTGEPQIHQACCQGGQQAVSLCVPGCTSSLAVTTVLQALY